MTNTLHRAGDADSFRDDYIVFAMCSRGKNDENSVPKLRQFLEMARRFNPVNLGDARHGGALRPSKSMNPLSHWRRNMKPDFDAVIAGLDVPTTAAAVFDNRVSAEGFLQAVRQADLGLSVNISTSVRDPTNAVMRRDYTGTVSNTRSGSKVRPIICPTRTW